MSKAPKAPDPYATSAAQTSSNQQTANYNADLNRVSQYTPLGSSVYTATGTGPSGAPLYRNDVSLTPQGQANLDNQLKQDSELSNLGFGLADQAKGTLGQGIDTSHLPGLNGAPGNTGQIQGNLDYSGAPNLPNPNDFNGAADAASDAAYGKATARLDPQFGNMQHDLDAKLANQGIVQGSEAYQRAQDEFGRQRTDAYGQARNDAFGQGLMAQNQGYGQSLATRGQAVGETTTAGNFANQSQAQRYAQALGGAQFGNQARQQGLSEQASLRQLPLNELNALRSGTQVQQPTFGAVPQSSSQPTDVSGNIYRSYQANVANSNNLMNGLFSVGSAALMASDRRLKHRIRRIGTTAVMRLPIYEYEYRGHRGKHIGVMADEVRKVAPQAVYRHSSGYRMVDYAQVA